MSVKTRVGVVDEHDNGDNQFDMVHFVEIIRPVCRRFIIHARKVHLQGLSARENRTIPPLEYSAVYALCRQFPDCQFNLNGGIRNLKQARQICYGNDNSDDDSATTSVPTNLLGVMMGRAAMENPSLFWDVDRYFYGMAENPCQNRRQVLLEYCHYLEETYPRRCCDHDDRITYRFPPPNVQRKRHDLYCRICAPMYSYSSKNGGKEFEMIDSRNGNSSSDVLSDSEHGPSGDDTVQGVDKKSCEISHITQHPAYY